MTLTEYLELTQTTDAAFARLSGIKHKQLIGRYRRGISIPGADNMNRILKATRGAVTANDFFASRTTEELAHV